MTSNLEGEFIELQPMERKISVYLPKEYRLDIERIFPAVFLHDGDFLFRESIDVIEQNVKAGLTEPVVFIGIDSENRNDEYTPWEHDALFSDWSFGGLGDNYLDFIYEQLYPYIKEQFRISEDIALGGVSLGGLISMYAMYRKRNLFQKYILLSSSVWFTNFMEYMESTAMDYHPKVYMYVGEKEGITKTNIQKNMVPNSKRAFHILQNTIAQPSENLLFETDPEGVHDDPFFLHYFPRSIQFLYPNKHV